MKAKKEFIVFLLILGVLLGINLWNGCSKAPFDPNEKECQDSTAICLPDTILVPAKPDTVILPGDTTFIPFPVPTPADTDTVFIPLPPDTLTLPPDTVYIETPPPLPLLIPSISIVASDSVEFGKTAVIEWEANADWIKINGIEVPKSGRKEFIVSQKMEMFELTFGNADTTVSKFITVYGYERVPLDVEPISISFIGSVSCNNQMIEVLLEDKIELTGHYQIRLDILYTSEYPNESFYVLVNDTGPTNPNISTYKIVADDGRIGLVEQYSGIFRLQKGTDKFQIYHYSKISNILPEFLNGNLNELETVQITGIWLEWVGEF